MVGSASAIGVPSTDRRMRAYRIFHARRHRLRTKPLPPIRAGISLDGMIAISAALSAMVLVVLIAVSTFALDSARRSPATLADGGSALSPSALRGAAALPEKFQGRVGE